MLIVEDEQGVLKLARRMLERNGFTTLETDNPDEAISLVEAYPHAIDLLLTDVVMPQRSGPELARHLHPLRPDMLVVYMSAYTSDRFGAELSQHTLLRKRFSGETITVKVRQTRDGARGHGT